MLPISIISTIDSQSIILIIIFVFLSFTLGIWIRILLTSKCSTNKYGRYRKKLDRTNRIRSLN